MTSGWKMYTTDFEFHSELPINEAPWGGHCFFAYDLVTNYKPKTIVELGTYKGYSFFSFAQAVKDHKLNAQLHCIDTWHGDKHAGFYGEELYKEFVHTYKKYYKDLNINIHKETFDNALKDFEENSVDLLHIDGLHTYEAVKHDFDSWIPKVRKDGIIILHDVCEIRDDFGVYKLWEELQNQYKNTLTFEHSHGLGVIFLGKPPKVQKDFLIKYYSLRSELESLMTDPDVNFINNYKREINLLNTQLLDKSKLINELSRKIDSLNTQLLDKSKLINELSEENYFRMEQIDKLGEELRSVANEANEFRIFKTTKIWYWLTKWRNLKRKVQSLIKRI